MILLAACNFTGCRPESLISQAEEPPPLNQPSPELVAGEPSTLLKIEAGENVAHRVLLQADEYLRITVEQHGADVELIWTPPDGTEVLAIDSPTGNRYREVLEIVARDSGEHRLDIRSGSKTPGRYRISVDGPRTASFEEARRARAVAQMATGRRLFAVGRGLFRRQRDSTVLQQAVESYRQALEIWRISADRHQEAAALERLGQVHGRRGLGQDQPALAFFGASLELFRELNDKPREASLLQSIGRLHWEARRYDQSLVARQHALELCWPDERSLAQLRSRATYFDLEPQDRDPRPDVCDPQGLATLLNGLAVHYQRIGETQAALNCYTEALHLYRSLKLKRHEATALSNLGELYYSLRHFERADDVLAGSLRLRRAALAASPSPDRQRQLAVTLTSLGKIRVHRSELARAFELFEEALDLLRQAGEAPDAVTLHNLARALEKNGEQAEALFTWRQALQSFRQSGDDRSVAYVLASLGHLVQELHPASALPYFTEAREIFRRLDDRNGEAVALFGLALIERGQGHLNRSKRHTEEVLGILESLRRASFSLELRSTFFSFKQQPYYDHYIDLLMQLESAQPAAGHAERAFEASEHRRARGLLDSLVETSAEIRRDADPALLNREEALVEQLQLRQAPQRKVLAELDRLRSHLRSTPRHRALEQAPILDLAAIRQLLEPQTMLVQFALGETRSFLFLVGAKTLETHVLPPRREIEAFAFRLRELLPKSHLSGHRGAYQVAARQLARMILVPAFSRLGAKRLLIAPDGALHYIPFSALPLPTQGDAPRLLIDRYEILYPPSMSIAALLLRGRADRGPVPGQLAVLADPVFCADDPRLKGAAKPAECGLHRLRHSRREARNILASASVGKRFARLGFDARRDVVTGGELAAYRILHFATHAEVDAVHPGLSKIVLSRFDAQGKSLQGFLSARQIQLLELNADLVVLSACNTALGKQLRGEGLLNLTRPFLYAGASRVLASLWSVDDLATAELMAKFYDHLLRRDQPFAEALRQAQLLLRDDPRFQAPAHWAGFVLQGIWDRPLNSLSPSVSI